MSRKKRAWPLVRPKGQATGQTQPAGLMSTLIIPQNVCKSRSPGAVRVAR